MGKINEWGEIVNPDGTISYDTGLSMAYTGDDHFLAPIACVECIPGRVYSLLKIDAKNNRPGFSENKCILLENRVIVGIIYEDYNGYYKDVTDRSRLDLYPFLYKLEQSKLYKLAQMSTTPRMGIKAFCVRDGWVIWQLWGADEEGCRWFAVPIFGGEVKSMYQSPLE